MADPATTPPPWVVHPGFGPGDGFWRQTGEAWITNVWTPFWASLSAEQQIAYHAYWRTPQNWRDVHFPDSAFQVWLNQVGDDATA